MSWSQAGIPGEAILQLGAMTLKALFLVVTSCGTGSQCESHKRCTVLESTSSTKHTCCLLHFLLFEASMPQVECVTIIEPGSSEDAGVSYSLGGLTTLLTI